MSAPVDSRKSSPLRERLLLGSLAVFLACLSVVYATMGGWSVSSASTLERLQATLPVLVLSAGTGLGAVALVLTVLRRPVWSWPLLLGLLPGAVQALLILTG